MDTEQLMLHPSYQIAKPILDLHEEELRYVPVEAWRRWLALPADHRRTQSAIEGGLAMDVAGYMKAAAAEKFDGRRDEGIIPRDKYDPPGWSFYNRVLVRFKKMDENGISKNYPTPRNRRYLLNLPIEEEDLREAVRVEVGYYLNQLETEIEQIWVVHRKGRRVVWKYGLMDDGTVVLPLAPPTLPLVDGGEETGPLVRPRVPSRKEEAEHEESRSRLLRVLPEEEESRDEAAESEAEHDTGSA